MRQSSVRTASGNESRAEQCTSGTKQIHSGIAELAGNQAGPRTRNSVRDVQEGNTKAADLIRQMSQYDPYEDERTHHEHQTFCRNDFYLSRSIGTKPMRGEIRYMKLDGDLMQAFGGLPPTVKAVPLRSLETNLGREEQDSIYPPH